MSAITLPVSSKSTWATNRLSPAADGIGESQLTTAMPASAAACVAVSIWSPALFDTMIAPTPWVTALVTNSTWPVLSAHDAGPTNSGSATPSSPAASMAPAFAWSNTAMPVHFGRRMLVKSPPSPAGASVAVGDASVPPAPRSPPVPRSRRAPRSRAGASVRPAPRSHRRRHHRRRHRTRSWRGRRRRRPRRTTW